MEAGSLLVAFGPAGSLLLSLTSSPQLWPLMLISGFFFLVAQLLAALIWTAIFPLKSIVLLQLIVRVFSIEIFRYIFFRLYRRGEDRFSFHTAWATSFFALQDLSSSLACGLAFGLVHSVTLFGLILRHSLGPAALYSPHCTQMSVFTLSAGLSVAFQTIHALLMTMAFDGYERSSPVRIGWVILLHLAAELLILLSQLPDGCNILLPSEFGVAVLAASSVVFILRERGHRSHMRGKQGFLRLEHKFCGKTLGRSGRSGGGGGSRRRSNGGSHRASNDGKAGTAAGMTAGEPRERARSKDDLLSHAGGGDTLKKTSTSMATPTAAGGRMQQFNKSGSGTPAGRIVVNDASRTDSKNDTKSMKSSMIQLKTRESFTTA